MGPILDVQASLDFKLSVSKGNLPLPKRMNFRKSSKGGGGSFSIQKFMLQIFAIIDDTSVMNFRKNCNITFWK